MALLGLLSGLLGGGTGAHAAPAPYGGSAVNVSPGAATIKVEAENYDTGGEGVAYHDYDNGGQTGYRSDNIGVIAQAGTSNGYLLGWQDGGEWEAYTINVTQRAAYTISAAVSCAASGHTFHLEFGPVGQVGGSGITASVPFSVPNTGSPGTFQNVSVYGVYLNAGTQWMRLVMDGYSPNVAGFDYISFASVANDGATCTGYFLPGYYVPTNMTAGQSYSVYVIMKNVGTTTWSEANAYRLSSANPLNNQTWGTSRVFLPAGVTVPPGVSYTLGFYVTTPPNPGTYNWQWNMVHELVGYFGDPTPNVPITVYAPAAVPTGLAATGGNAQVSLSWTAASGAVSYSLYRGTTPGGEGATPVKTGIPASALPSVVDTGRTNGTTYYYQVTAVNAAGTESGRSVEKSATPQMPDFSLSVSPSSLSILQGGSGTSTVTVSPTNGFTGSVSLIATYRPTGVSVAFSPASVTGGGNSTATFSVPRSIAVGTYTVTVQGTSGSLVHTTPVTLTVTAGVNQPPTVSAGTNQTITLPSTASLSGTASDDGLPNPPAMLTTTWSQISGPGTVTFGNASVAATTASFSTAGTYVLRLSASDSTLMATSDVTITVNAAPLAAPVLSGSMAGTTASLSWTAPAGAVTYSLFRSSDSGANYTQIGTGLTATTYSDSGLAGNTNFLYYVVANDTGGASSPPSNTLNLTTTNPPLPAPSNLIVVSTCNNQASLSWSGVSGATGYNVKRSTTSGFGYSTVANVTSTSCMDQGLTNGTTYYYVVTALNGASESIPSNQVTATPVAEAFGFLNVGDGSVLSGQVTLYVSMASRAYGSEANPVTFSVDGIVYDSGGDQQQNSGNAGANTFFVLATDAFANGTHTLSIQDGNGNSASVNVTFNNVLYSVNVPIMFDTSGGDGLPTSADITASLTSAQPWTVSVVTVDNAGSTVRTFSGNSANINVSWDGNDSQGVEVDDDAYEIDISYGGGTQSTTSGMQPMLGAAPTIKRNLLSKNKVGDCFIFLDENVFPSGYADMIAYVKAIKADLAPSKGVVWNKFSFIIHGTRQPNWTASQIQRIDRHFMTPLTVFYVDAHGGPGKYGGSEWFSGGHYWESSAHPFNDVAHHSLIPVLTQSANYGVNNPPALVFIDSCNSAGDSQDSPDVSFANAFDIGDGPSGFIGWSAEVVAYGAAPPPHDDFTFWRLDLWSQFTNYNQTYDTAYSHLLRDYNVHGHNANANGLTPDQMEVNFWPSGSAF